MGDRKSILAVVDDGPTGERLVELLRAEGYRVSCVAGWPEGFRSLVQQTTCDLIILDTESRPDIPWEDLRSLEPDPEIVLLTSFSNLGAAVEATRQGVSDFVVKPFRDGELLLAVRNGVERKALRLENQRLRETLSGGQEIAGLVGRSQSVRRTLDTIRAIGPLNIPALITGERGTGKRLVARALHDLSPRSRGPFVTLRGREVRGWLECEKEARGPGVREEATDPAAFARDRGGTLFVEGLQQLSDELQSRLLMSIGLQGDGVESACHRHGSPYRLVIALESGFRASSQQTGGRVLELLTLPRTGHVHMPPLRERREDIPRLVDHLLREASTVPERQPALTPNALRALLDYDWPGNVEELRLVLELAVGLVSPQLRIRASCLPSHILDAGRRRAQPEQALERCMSLKDMVADFEREIILEALQRNDWNQRQTAVLLRTIPTTLNQKIRRLHISEP